MKERRRWLPALGLTGLCALALLAAPDPAAAAYHCTLGVDIGLDQEREPSPCTHFGFGPGRAAFPITAGPDGRLWFFIEQDSALFAARMTTTGTVDRFPMPPGPAPGVLAPGPDGNVWYGGQDRIGRITPAGEVTEYPTPGITVEGITTGPDRALWFTAGPYVGRLTAQGVSYVLVGDPNGSMGYPTPMFFYDRPYGGQTHAIVTGADGALWVAANSELVRVSTAGAVSRVPLRDSPLAFGPLAVASDGSIWYTTPGVVARLTPLGRVEVLGHFRGGHDLVRGPGRSSIWLSEVAYVERLSSDGFTTRKPHEWSCAGQTVAACWFNMLPSPVGDFRDFTTHGLTGGLTVGPDGNIWVIERTQVGRMLTFRGAMPCYERVTRDHDFGCGHFVSRRVRLTKSRRAYFGTSCARLTFRLCHGTATVRTLGRRFVASAPFIIAAYDNPHVGVRLPRWFVRSLGRGKRVRVTYTSEDQGGLRATNGGDFDLVPAPR